MTQRTLWGNETVAKKVDNPILRCVITRSDIKQKNWLGREDSGNFSPHTGRCTNSGTYILETDGNRYAFCGHHVPDWVKKQAKAGEE